MGRSDIVTTKKYYPFVSVCTPTFNRRPFIQMMFQCFLNQDYPRNRMEWIIVDDGSDPIEDLVVASRISQIKYFRDKKKMPLGEKRNYMHSKAKGSIIVYMDDDDYYPPERVSHAVDMLTSNKDALCAGSSEIYIYFKHIQKMYQSGPYGPNHSTAGTFAFKSELLKHTSYDNTAALAEEKHFLKNYTIPFVQLDPLKTILVFSHEHNTFDKRRLLENLHPDYFKESTKTVDMFIKNPIEAPIIQFFMHDIDELLKSYRFGQPAMKPDVLKQMKILDAERKKAAEQAQAEQNKQVGQFMINEDGKPPRPITQEEIVELMNHHIEQNKVLSQKNQSLEAMVVNLQKKIAENTYQQPEKSNAFADILLARINELETKISDLQQSHIPQIPQQNPQQIPQQIPQQNQTILDKDLSKPVSKSTPEVMVDIHTKKSVEKMTT